MRTRLLRIAVIVLASVAVAGPSTLVGAGQAAKTVIAEVRAAIAKNDFALGERLLKQHVDEHGQTPQALEAHSWLARGALAQKKLDEAEAYARDVYDLSLDALKTRPLDAEKNLPIALGASIEVQAHVLAQRGRRADAVRFLNRELATYRATSIRTRIQKNINLLTLEGQPAPALEVSQYFGSKPRPLVDLKGKVVLMMFWAHWCGDCKAQAPVLAAIQSAYRDKGLVLVGPTKRYGYIGPRTNVPPEEEMAHIEQVRTKFYSMIADWPTPVDDETFTLYGASTTPTLVLVDRQGVVRLYHPGNLTEAELRSRIDALVGT